MTDGLAPNRLDRAELISLLETLGSDNDEEVLAAAHVLDTKVAAAGTSWSVLLAANVGAGGGANGAAAENGPAEAEAPATEDQPEDAGSRNAEALALIGKLLARSGQSEEFRQELEGYKADIAAGEFTDSDHTYLRALHKRLGG